VLWENEGLELLGQACEPYPDPQAEPMGSPRTHCPRKNNGIQKRTSRIPNLATTYKKDLTMIKIS
ncbi:hypothetical protein EVA_21005, partial [gut metagenome]